MQPIRFNERDVEGSNYLPEGDNEVTVVDISQTMTKDSGNPMLVFLFKDRLGREAKEHVPLVDKTKWKLATIAKACGVTKETLLTQGLNPMSLKGKRLILVKKQTGVREIEGGKTVKDYSQDYFPIQGGQQGAGSAAQTDDIPF